MSAPAFALIALVTIFPIGLAMLMSFTQVRTGPGTIEFDWVGVANYQEVLTSSATHQALMFTTIFTVVSVSLQLVVGVAIALVMDEMARGRGIVLAMLLIPYSMITVIAAQIWSYIVNGVYGIANYFLVTTGLTDAPINILGTPQGAFLTALVADSWKTIPFVVLIVLAGLRMIDRELYAAAEVDGASWFTRVIRITLPLLVPSIVTAAIFRILHAFGIFDMIFVLTQGGPGTSTTTIALLAYNALFQDLNIGKAATLSTLATVIILAVSLFFIRTFRDQAKEEARE